MNRWTLALSALLMLSLVVLLAPGVLALNRGKMLRNIALWLAIVLGLAIVYQQFGPLLTAAPADRNEESGASHTSPIGDKGYVPPGE